MKISIQSLLERARNANGTVAVIDSFRAFTTAAVALANGASRIIMVGTVEEALALRAGESGGICMGEVRGEAPDGLDYGNSPFEIATVDLSGKTIIQRTSAGTQGIVAASTQADRLYAGFPGRRGGHGPSAACRFAPARSRSSQWVTMASFALTRTSLPPSI